LTVARAPGRTCGAPQEPRKLNSIVAARRAKLSQPAGITITALWLPKNSQLWAASGSAEVLSCTIQIGDLAR
jgi:hypothetical protein